MEESNELHGLFVLRKSGNMGDKFPLQVQTTDMMSDSVSWIKGFLWIKTDTAMECEKENFAKNSEYGDPDIRMGGENGKLSDLLISRVVFQKEGDAFVSNMPVFCAMTKFQDKDVYLFTDCVMGATLTATNEASGEVRESPVWIIPFSENHPDDYLTDDDDYDLETMKKWPFCVFDEEEWENE